MKTIDNTSVAIIGFGAQAKAWARNFKDSTSACKVILRSGSSSNSLAMEQGFQILNFQSPELNEIKVFCVLTPDDSHAEILSTIAPFAQPEATFIYAHGYSNVVDNLNEKYPQFNHLLLAPKAIASEVRFRYENKQNIMTAFSLEFAPKWNLEQLQTFAAQFGFTKLINTSFKEETNADLFSEQSLLCSLIPYGALHSYQKLRTQGVKKELAFIECWMEVLLIAKAMVEHGPTGLFDLISPNALIGGQKAVSTLFDKDFDNKLDQIMSDVWSGRFYNHVDKTDFPKLKEEVLNFWNNKEIQKVYEDLKPFL